MFNLENKITWKELAPSLQAMFKTLQSQITDIKNEVNNINISLGDINDHLTQIDKDITNLNNNITTIIQDTVEDIVGEMMFLNLAPKIGYYQEDKIEVISKYNMNNVLPTTNAAVPGYGFTNMNNQEIVFELSNDGSKNNSSKWDLFYGYRISTSTPFTFVNEPLDVSKYLNTLQNNPTMKRIYGIGSNYIFVVIGMDNTAQRYCLYLTHQSLDTNNWEYIEISDGSYEYWSVYYDESKRDFYMLRHNIYSDSYASNSDTIYSFDIMDVDNKSIVFHQYLDNPCKTVYAQYPYSFSSSSAGSNGSIYNKTAYSASINSGYNRCGSILLKKRNLLLFFSNWFNITYWNLSTGVSSIRNVWLKCIYHIPQSVFDNYSGTITMMNDVTSNLSYDNVDDRYKGRYWIQNDFNSYNGNVWEFLCNIGHSNITTYDDNNGIYYVCGAYRDNYSQRYTTVCRISDNPYVASYDPSDKQKFIKQGMNYFTRYHSLENYFPDASLWGKSIQKFASIFRLTFVGESRDSTVNSNGLARRYISCQDYQLAYGESFDNSVERSMNIIECVPGKYDTIKYSASIYYFGNSICVENGKPNYYYLNEIANNGNGTVHTTSFTVVKATDTTEGYGVNFSVAEYKKIDISFCAYKDTSFPYLDKIGNNIFIDQGGIKYCIISLHYNNIANILFGFVANRNKGTAQQGRLWPLTINLNSKTFKIFDDATSDSKLDQHSKGLSTYFTNKLDYFFHNQDSYRIIYCSLFPLFSDNNSIFYLNQAIYSQGSIERGYYRNRSYFKFTDSTFMNLASCSTCINDGNGLGSSNGAILYGGCIEYTEKTGYLLCYSDPSGNTAPLTIYTSKPLLPQQSGMKEFTIDEFAINDSTKGKYRYRIYLQSSQGLVAYIPSIPIFLGGYFSIIENPIPVTLQPNSDNYIYIERDSNDRTNIIASSSTTRTINEGDKVFNKILCAKVTTDSANMISVEYYRINTGYNDYSFA